jgi:hypothetical protein
LQNAHRNIARLEADVHGISRGLKGRARIAGLVESVRRRRAFTFAISQFMPHEHMTCSHHRSVGQ